MNDWGRCITRFTLIISINVILQKYNETTKTRILKLHTLYSLLYVSVLKFIFNPFSLCVQTHSSPFWMTLESFNLHPTITGFQASEQSCSVPVLFGVLLLIPCLLSLSSSLSFSFPFSLSLFLHI